MSKYVSEMLNQKTWAVVGATQNPSKFGNKIFKRLLSAGYEVYPVNPVYGEVETHKCYPSLTDLPILPDCVNVVVAPDKALAVAEEAKALGISYIWFQPGAYDNATIARATELGLKVVHDHNCVLVELGQIGK